MSTRYLKYLIVGKVGKVAYVSHAHRTAYVICRSLSSDTQVFDQDGRIRIRSPTGCLDAQLQRAMIMPWYLVFIVWLWLVKS